MTRTAGQHQSPYGVPTSVATVTHALCADLQARLIDYASRVEELRTPTEVLHDLCAITTSSLPLSVLGAARLPLKSRDWGSLELGKSAFLHEDVPKGWWEEYDNIARDKFRPMLFLAQSSMASHTWTEVRRMLEPIGIDRWADELALKYGMRDGLTCPVGGRWVVAFWSRKELSKILTQQTRNRDLCGREFRGSAPGAVGWPGRQSDRLARSLDPQGNSGLAFGLDGGAMPRRGRGARSWRRDSPQSPEKGASQAWHAQSSAHGGRSLAAEPNTVRSKRARRCRRRRRRFGSRIDRRLLTLSGETLRTLGISMDRLGAEAPNPFYPEAKGEASAGPSLPKIR